jgi:hypothetical protein
MMLHVEAIICPELAMERLAQIEENRPRLRATRPQSPKIQSATGRRSLASP